MPIATLPTLHVPALPHTVTRAEDSVCAYTTKVLRFCKMMSARGHRVIHYGNEGSTVAPAEHVEIFSSTQQQQHYGGEAWFQRKQFYCVPWDNGAPWRQFNRDCAYEIKQRAHPRDIVCIIGGVAQREIADLLSDQEVLCVEYGIGYEGTFAPYRAFESYAWMHHVYGLQQIKDGRAFDAVIPNYFDPDDFTLGNGGGDYLLYMSRMTPRKGYDVAVETARRSGLKLVMAGAGTEIIQESFVEHVGQVGPAERNKLMGGARALLVPTQYIEPFGGVAIEALFCGTPVITTDWGAFTETVGPRDGARCKTLEQFVRAAQRAHTGFYNRESRRDHAINRFALNAVAPMFEEWFQQLQTLYGEGWYAA